MKCPPSEVTGTPAPIVLEDWLHLDRIRETWWLTQRQPVEEACLSEPISCLGVDPTRDSSCLSFSYWPVLEADVRHDRFDAEAMHLNIPIAGPD